MEGDVIEAAEQIVERAAGWNRVLEVALWVYIGFAFGFLVGKALVQHDARRGLTDLLDRI
jgi:hypothetical protein